MSMYDELLTNTVKKSLEETNKTVLDAITKKDETIKAFRAELDKVKDEKYKDEELVRMKEQVDRVLADNRRGFSITEDEWEALKKWQEAHVEKQHGGKVIVGCIGGLWKYVFVPTSIGTIGTCECSVCKNRIDEEVHKIDSFRERSDKRTELMKKYNAEFTFQEI